MLYLLGYLRPCPARAGCAFGDLVPALRLPGDAERDLFFLERERERRLDLERDLFFLERERERERRLDQERDLFRLEREQERRLDLERDLFLFFERERERRLDLERDLFFERERDRRLEPTFFLKRFVKISSSEAPES